MTNSTEPQLQRRLSLLLITFYGIGTILGAGIYVLVGKVAGEAGSFTPLAFLVAACLAAFSAFSYAELAARFPKSAGEAVYVHQAFTFRFLSTGVGLAIVALGILSTATLIHGLVNYLHVFFDVGRNLTVIIVALLLGGVVAWGIGQSVAIAALLTVVEVFGLLLILWVARPSYDAVADQLPSLFMPAHAAAWSGVFTGAFIAFYAYIGYEDIVNVAEEVKNPQRNLPRAIIISLVVTTTLYIAVSVASLAVTGVSQLAGSNAPLALVYQLSTGKAPVAITLISLVSVLNGALVQIIMASRVLYGMSRQGWLPAVLGRVNAHTHTPLYATAGVTMVILAFALALPLLALAKLTSFVTLTVFSLINLSLLQIKRRSVDAVTSFTVPMWVPLTGFVLTTAFLVFQIVSL